MNLDQNSKLKHALTVFVATVLALIGGALLNDHIVLSKAVIISIATPIISTAIRAAWNAYLGLDLSS